MRIHQVLEACVDFVAIEGVLGSDPYTLLQHLKKLDSTIDHDYFAHIFALLASNPSIQLILTTCPLEPVDGPFLLGTAALPADYQLHGDADRNVDVETLYEQGIRGRQLAFRLAGQDFKSDKETMVDNREARRQTARKRKKVGNVDENGAGPSGAGLTDDGVASETPQIVTLWKYIEADDGGLGEDRVPRSDFKRLLAKWGSRLRIRATDDEIYYRLVGSHHKNPKVTPVVFHVLQLAARTREKGITAIELGPAAGASQGSLHYYMKVLGTLGLTAKVPAAIHGAVTNLLIFHRFLEQNENYRAVMKLPPLVPAEAPTTAVDTGEACAEIDSEDENDQADDVVSGVSGDWGLNFALLTESALMAGHVVKERLIKLLDHSMLKNHLLKRKNLLPLLGWQREQVMRHRRAMSRHIDTLIMDGILESIEVGEKRTKCLRLTKHNPDFLPTERQSVRKSALVPDEEQSWEVLDSEVLAPSHAEAYSYRGGASITVPIEHQVNRLILDSGAAGMTIADIRARLDGMFKRTVEFHYVRSETAYVPPNLRSLRIKSIMESYGRERRLRAFSISAFRELMSSQAQPVDNEKHPPDPPEAGHWSDVRVRQFYHDYDQVIQQLDTWAGEKFQSFEGYQSKVKSRNSGAAKRRLQTNNSPGGSEIEEIEKPIRKKPVKYVSDKQVRGRPRKYIHVVEESGKPNRSIIGETFPDPDLEAIYIYVQSINKLVPAPDGYSGLGPPPLLTAEDMKKGKSPNWFAKFPRHKDMVASSKKRGGKALVRQSKRKRKSEGGETGNEAASSVAKRSKSRASYDMPETLVDAQVRADNDVRENEDQQHAEGGMSILADAAHNVPTSVVPQVDLLSGEIDQLASDKETQAPPKRGRPKKVTSDPNDEPNKSKSSTQSRVVEITSTAQTLDSRAETPASSLQGSAKSEVISPETRFAPLQAVADEVPDRLATTSMEDAMMAAGILAASSNASPAPTPKRGRKQKSVAFSNRVPAPVTPRRPSPMIGEYFTPNSPIFEFPQGEQPKESGFVLPQAFHRFKRIVEKKAEQSDTPVRDLVASPSTDLTVCSAHGETDMPPSSASETAGLGDTARAVTLVMMPPPAPPTDRTVAPETPVARPSSTQPLVPPLLTPVASFAYESTPLREVTNKIEPQPDPPTSNRGTARLDLGYIRRQNELCQTLKEFGGVLSDHKLRNEHYEWTKRVAGTDAPFAPAIAAQMDRQVFRRAVASLQSQGRLKQTIAKVPTTTGRWVSSVILYLPETSQEMVQSYILELGTTLSQLLTPPKTPRTSIAATEFTEVRIPSRSSAKSKLKTDVSSRREALATPTQDRSEQAVDPAERRAALFKEIHVVSFLYGFLSGRGARLETFHKAIMGAIRRSSNSEFISSSTPIIIALPFLFHDLSVKEWYSCISSARYSEELEEYLHDPVKRNTKLSDLPSQFQPAGGFGGHRSKTKLNSLLSSLEGLKLIEPLAIAEGGDATLACQDQVTGKEISFRPAPVLEEAMYFRVYEYAPVYHIAADASSLLGVMPVQSQDQLDVFWSALKSACLHSDINSLPRVEHTPTPEDLVAPLSDVLDLSVDLQRVLRQRMRWKSDARLLEVQRSALDDLIDPETGTSRLQTKEQIDAFAWEYALPRDFVVKYISNWGEVIRQKVTRAQRLERERAETRRVADRHQRAEASLKLKMAEIRAAGKAEWEARVKAAALRTDVPHTKALEDFLARYSLQTLNRKGPLTDEAMDEGCRLLVRSQTVGNLARPEQSRPTALRKAPFTRKVRKDKKIRPVKDPNKPKTRRRKQWSYEDDDLLLDAEAVIRARCRDQPSVKGRPAMVQVFPDVGVVTALHRLQKIWIQPGRHAYFERLIDAWYDVWIKYRGTPELPDEHPESIVNFDLKAHVAFLREKVSKQTVRLTAAAGTKAEKEKTAMDLPKDVISLLTDHSWTYQTMPVSSLNAYWEVGGGDDQRLKEVGSVAVLEEAVGSRPPIDVVSSEIREGRLRAVLKMIIATPEDQYYEPAATALLSGFSNVDVQEATTALIDEKVIRRIHRGAFDGRVFQFTIPWVQSLEGPFPEDLHTEAASVEKMFDGTDDYIDWSIIAQGGEVATLMQMVSNGEVDFDFNINEFPTIKFSPDTYNTRRLNDDDFEFDLKVRRVAKGSGPRKVEMPPITGIRKMTAWGDGQSASAPDQQVVDKVLAAIKNAGAQGLTKPQIKRQTEMSTSTFGAILNTLASQNPTCVFWGGYDTARLIYSDYWREWSIIGRPAMRNSAGHVIAVTTEERRICPRRWINIYGERMETEWHKAKRAVMGQILSRPSMTERSLRAKLAPILDRLEANDVLQSLVDERVVYRSWIDSQEKEVMPPVDAMDVEEEKMVVWRPAIDVLWH